MTDNKNIQDDFHDFIRWLEDHNYCKVVPCSQCYFWHDRQDPEYSYPEATCRRHKIKTYHDDYCSDALERKKNEAHRVHSSNQRSCKGF